MRAALLILVGVVFSGLLLVLPATHASRWLDAPLDGLGWAAVALPFLILPGAATSRRAWLTLWAWPTAHLPALLVAPTLTGPTMYAGRAGLWAALALAVAGAAYVLVALWPARLPTEDPSEPTAAQPRRRLHTDAHPLSLLALVLTLAVAVAFAQAAFATDDVDPLAANITLLAGALVASWVAIHAIATDLGGVVFDPAARRRHRAQLLVGRRPPRRRLIITFVAAAAMVLLATTWHLLHSR